MRVNEDGADWVVIGREPGMRELSIDTWLYHGDRKRMSWLWTGHTYSSPGRGEDIPAPTRPRRRP